MSQGFLAIDGNHIGHAANAAATLHAGEIETQAIYGTLRSIRPAITIYATLTPLVLWDGASWRKTFFDDYKASRRETLTKSDQKLADMRASFNRQKPYIKQALAHLGIAQMIAVNLEADDLAAFLVRRYQPAGKKIMLISGDKDWIQLLRPGVGWLDPIRNVRLTEKTLPKRLGWCPDKKKIVASTEDRDDLIGVPSPQAWLEMKCLMGDVSDDIPGVGGIGPKGAIELLTEHGSVATFMNRYLDGTLTDLPAKLEDFARSVEKHEAYRRNQTLMDLNAPSVPKPDGLSLDKGAFDPDAFRALCEELSFRSILANFDAWIEPFRRLHHEGAAA